MALSNALNSTLSLEYDLAPGHGLGPFVLGTSLWTVLEYLREAKVSFPQVNVKYDSENPVTSPVILHLLPYIDLLFSGHSQRLHTISVRRLRPVRQGMPLILRYRNETLASSDQPLRKAGVTKYFGPTYPGDTMRYPGIWFGFLEDGEEMNASSKSTVMEDRNLEVKKIVICQKTSDGSNENDLAEVKECQVMIGAMAQVVARPHKGISIHFYPLGTPPVDIHLGASAEDLSCDLGPPLRVFYKEDDRMDIHAVSRQFSNLEETDYFYNYFQFGLDFLICGTTHRIKKIILHSNVPGSPAFQRYARCPWVIRNSTTEEELKLGESTVEVSFTEKLEALSGVFPSSEPSNSPSMELEQIEDERLSLPNSKTQLTGFDGIVVESSLGNTLTVLLF
ncbi:hypothetical protein M422DRAFT_22762 [Sphaerobolus stellatus SS14]|nr:hypothetical protein M422DRAFT_22762 [Sphaerobolus stellatus SS14]